MSDLLRKFKEPKDYNVRAAYYLGASCYVREVIAIFSILSI
jgi:hypothetical protein